MADAEATPAMTALSEAVRMGLPAVVIPVATIAAPAQTATTPPHRARNLRASRTQGSSLPATNERLISSCTR